MKKSVGIISAVIIATLGACSVADQGQNGTNTETVTVLTHDSFELSDELKARFESESGYKLQTTSPGDSGTVINQLILNKENPAVDAVFGIDNFAAYRAIEEDLIADYTPAGELAADLRIGGLTAIDRGDVCLNADANYFSDIPMPKSFAELTDPMYKDLLVVTNPVTSTPGFAFLVGTIESAGDNWMDYWNALLDNGTKVVDSWSTAFYTDFSAADGAGDYPLVLSYASSPAYGEGAFVTVPGTCVTQVEYAAVVKGARNSEGAQKFVDFMLSDEVQKEIPNFMYMYPIADAELPAQWAMYAQRPANSLNPDPQTVAENREQWQREWTALFEGR